MHSPSRFLLVAALAWSACTSGAPSQPAQGQADLEQDRAAVLEQFEAYRTAVLARDGQRASELMDRRTIEAYQEYLDLARTADRAGLERLDWMGKLMVLRIRHEFDAKALAGMTGLSLMARGVERGWVSDASVHEVKIAKTTITGARAWLSLVQQPDAPMFHFIKESTGWRFSLWQTFSLAEPVFTNMYADSGQKDPLDWLITLIEAVSPRQFDRALLDGPPR